MRRALAIGLGWVLAMWLAPVGQAWAQPDEAAKESAADQAEQKSSSSMKAAAMTDAAEQQPKDHANDPRARPPLPSWKPPSPPVWRRRIEVGGAALLVHRPFNKAVVATDVGYRPALAWGLHMHWNIFPFLRFTPYFIDAHHGLRIGQGALATATERSISPNATIETPSVRTFVFGAKIAPTWNLTARARAWVSAGIGWGRFEFPKMSVVEDGRPTFDIGERDASFVEAPIGIGFSFDIIPRWLAVEYEVTGAPVFGPSGRAHETVQAVDPDGETRNVAGFGAIEASFTQSLGLSLLL